MCYWWNWITHSTKRHIYLFDHSACWDHGNNIVFIDFILLEEQEAPSHPAERRAFSFLEGGVHIHHNAGNPLDCMDTIGQCNGALLLLPSVITLIRPTTVIIEGVTSIHSPTRTDSRLRYTPPNQIFLLDPSEKWEKYHLIQIINFQWLWQRTWKFLSWLSFRDRFAVLIIDGVAAPHFIQANAWKG